MLWWCLRASKVLLQEHKFDFAMQGLNIVVPASQSQPTANLTNFNHKTIRHTRWERNTWVSFAVLHNFPAVKTISACHFFPARQSRKVAASPEGIFFYCSISLYFHSSRPLQAVAACFKNGCYIRDDLVFLAVCLKSSNVSLFNIS